MNGSLLLPALRVAMKGEEMGGGGATSHFSFWWWTQSFRRFTGEWRGTVSKNVFSSHKSNQLLPHMQIKILQDLLTTAHP